MIKRGGQNIVVPKKGFVVHKDDWSVYKVPPSKGDTGEAYLPAWWAVNLDLRRSLDYIKHWQIGSKSADMRSLQHDTGLDPSYALDQTEAMISRFDTDFKHAWPGDETYDVYEMARHEGGGHQPIFVAQVAEQPDRAAAKGAVHGGEGAGLRAGDLRDALT